MKKEHSPEQIMLISIRNIIHIFLFFVEASFMNCYAFKQYIDDTVRIESFVKSDILCYSLK